uniref:Putative zonular occludens toxin protein n=1 Tax=viral metagenome TaxID=1070528 RepID=A0A6H1Z5X9_9ZZZZ
MMYLLTATPGTGKSTHAMDYLLEAEKKGRPLFVHGIQGLKIDHHRIFCKSTSCLACENMRPYIQNSQTVINSLDIDTTNDREVEILYVEDWKEWAPKLAYIVIDECQHAFRPRPSGSKIPEYASGFEMHRHLGIDFLLITQDPMQFDGHARKLVNVHWHLQGSWSGGVIKEWAFCQTDVLKDSSVKRPYKPKPKNWEYFKSSEAHTPKPRFRRPRIVYVAASIFVLFIVTAYYSVGRASNGLFSGNNFDIAEEQIIPEGIEQNGFEGVSGLPIAPSHPFADWDIRLSGVSKIGSKVSAFIEFTKSGMNSNDMIVRNEGSNNGYKFVPTGSCSGFLMYDEYSQPLSCAPKKDLEQQATEFTTFQ